MWLILIAFSNFNLLIFLFFFPLHLSFCFHRYLSVYIICEHYFVCGSKIWQFCFCFCFLFYFNRFHYRFVTFALFLFSIFPIRMILCMDGEWIWNLGIVHRWDLLCTFLGQDLVPHIVHPFILCLMSTTDGPVRLLSYNIHLLFICFDISLLHLDHFPSNLNPYMNIDPPFFGILQTSWFIFCWWSYNSLLNHVFIIFWMNMNLGTIK